MGGVKKSNLRRPLEVAKADAASVHVVVSARSLVAELKNLSDWAESITLIFAWASSANGTAPHWKALDLAKIERALIGVHFNQTEPEALRVLMDLGVLRVFGGSNGVFHPKVVVGVRGTFCRAIIGSSNFTAGGYGSNVEVNVVIAGDLSSATISTVLAFADAQWGHWKTFEPDKEWLKNYEIAWQQRPTPPRTPHSPGPDRVEGEGDLKVSFDDYFRIVVAQENRILADGDTIRVFDDERGSYLQEAEACRAAFAAYKKFAKMPVDLRRLVAGWGDKSSGYFGRMVGAGYFKQVVLDHPTAIGEHLDRVPLVGKVSAKLAVDVLEGLLGVRGVAIGTATRLLTMKRPDLFLTVNRANRERLREVLGSSPVTAHGYLKLHQKLWAMPWAAESEPINEDQRRVWAARVGLLDAIFYDPQA